MLLFTVALALAASADVSYDKFRKDMSEAMMQMHHAMNVPYSGNTDRDFATMMIPHHQGAIDMAKVELEYGKNQRLRRLAQGVIVEQQQEIQVMHATLDELPPVDAKPNEHSPK